MGLYEKFLDQKFWSHGTPLGSLGPLSREVAILGAVRLQILVIWGPYEPPEVVPLNVQPENPKTTASWCGTDVTTAKERKSTHGHTYLMRKWFELNYVDMIAPKRKERNLRKGIGAYTR